MQSLSEILTPGETLCYVSYLRDIPYSTNWMLYEGTVPGPGGRALHHLRFFAETDLASVGLGGPIERMRTELYCEGDLSPRRYTAYTRHAVNRADFRDGGVRLTLPDGSHKDVTLEPFEALAGDNVAQLALCLRRGRADREPVYSTRLFTLGGVTVFEYRLDADPERPAVGGGRWFRSSFLDHVYVDDAGWLTRLEDPQHGTVTVREHRPPPGWRDADLFEPPLEYHRPEGGRFRLVDTSVRRGDVSIGITLTIPDADGPHPVAVYIAGTGVHDRHGMAGLIDLGSHEIVDFLSDHGWLGVRFDARGAGTTALGEGFLDMGYEESRDDARAVIAHVLEHAQADPGRLVLIGHSQGGLTAAELAASDLPVRAIALLAAPGRPAEQVLRDQVENQARWLAQTREQVDAQLAELDAFVALVRSDVEWTPERVPSRFYSLKRQRKWYADVLARDPADIVASVPCPVLVCQGAKDFQVSLDRDARRLCRERERRGGQVELAVFEDLDHLFKPVVGESHLRDYYDRTRRVSPALLHRLLGFLTARVTAPADR